MKTLEELVKEKSVDQSTMFSITASLIAMIDRKELCHLSPSAVSLDEQGEVKVVQEDDVNCDFAAPDVVLNYAEPTQDSMWFSLGCLLFYMIRGESFYSAYDLESWDCAQNQQGTSLIRADQCSDPAAEAIENLTAWNPQDRIKGVGMALNLMKAEPCIARVRYVCDGRTVLEECITVSQSSADFLRDRVIQGSDAVTYRVHSGVKFECMPGTHPVTVPVVRVSEASGPAPVHSENSMFSCLRDSLKDGNWWLVLSCKDPENPGKKYVLDLFPLGTRAYHRAIPLILDSQGVCCYTFYAVRADQNAPDGIASDKLLSQVIPPLPNANTKKLDCAYYVKPKGFSFHILDANGLISVDLGSFLWKNP